MQGTVIRLKEIPGYYFIHTVAPDFFTEQLTYYLFELKFEGRECFVVDSTLTIKHSDFYVFADIILMAGSLNEFGKFLSMFGIVMKGDRIVNDVYAKEFMTMLTRKKTLLS